MAGRLLGARQPVASTGHLWIFNVGNETPVEVNRGRLVPESRFSRGLLYLGGTRNPLVDVGPFCFLLVGSRDCTCGALST